MKNSKCFLAVLCLLLPLFAWGQGKPSQSNYPPVLLTGSGAPSGNCTGTNYLYLNTVNGNLYTCPVAGSAWVLAGGGGGTYSFFGNTANPLTVLLDGTDVIDQTGNQLEFNASIGIALQDFGGDTVAVGAPAGRISLGDTANDFIQLLGDGGGGINMSATDGAGQDTFDMGGGGATIEDLTQNLMTMDVGGTNFSDQQGDYVAGANSTGTLTLHDHAGDSCTLHSGLFSCSTPINATTGYKIGNAAPSGHYERGNGTNYVDGTIQAGDLPAGTTPTGCTSNCSYVLGQGDLPVTVSSTGVALANANQGFYARFYNALSRSLGNVCTRVITGVSSTHYDVGVYSISGSTGTLIWHTGSISSATSNTITCSTVTPVTLPPGAYYEAWCSDSMVATLSGVSTATLANTLAAAGPANTYGNDATDTCTAGVLPSTITITNISNSSTNEPAYVYASN